MSGVTELLEAALSYVSEVFAKDHLLISVLNCEFSRHPTIRALFHNKMSMYYVADGTMENAKLVCYFIDLDYAVILY